MITVQITRHWLLIERHRQAVNALDDARDMGSPLYDDFLEDALTASARVSMSKQHNPAAAALAERIKGDGAGLF
jgi:hypothetical protein